LQNKKFHWTFGGMAMPPKSVSGGQQYKGGPGPSIWLLLCHRSTKRSLWHLCYVTHLYLRTSGTDLQVFRWTVPFGRTLPLTRRNFLPANC